MNQNGAISQPSQVRIGYLDTLRGFAAASVAIKHYFLVFGVVPFLQGLSPFLPKNFYYDGNPEVAFFFVLSGFVLSYGTLNGGSSVLAVPLWRTYLARAARIYPAFLFVFAVSYFARDYAYKNIVTDEHWGILRYHWPQTVTLAEFFRQITLMPFTNRGMPLVSPDWTLVNEVEFSMLLPFLLLVVRHSLNWFFFLCLLFLCFFTGHENLFLGFGLGIAIAYFFKRLTLSLGPYRAVQLTFFLAAIGLYYGAPYLRVPGEYAASVAGALILVWAISSSAGQRLLSIRPLRYLGQISYSVYLCHFVLLLAVAPYWRTMTLQYENSFLFEMLLYSVCVLLFSSATYYLIERPGILLGQWIKKRSS